jgi:branched-chain amino acid transport system permease protein
LLRNRTGVALQAIRDDEEVAASLGVRVWPVKFVLFVLAGFGCGAAGALTLANTLFIQPQSIFGVQWSAYLIFMVLVGGLGTFEGPIIGAILFFVIQYEFADLGAWYLIGLGLIAIAFALFLPRGLWSLVNDRLHIRLLPVGYHLLYPQLRDPGSGGA